MARRPRTVAGNFGRGSWTPDWFADASLNQVWAGGMPRVVVALPDILTRTRRLSPLTPLPTEGLMTFCHTGLNLGHVFSFSDVANAFCQSRPLQRPKGPLCAKPCEGRRLNPGDLIVTEVPVYGLDDAPAEWRATVVAFLQEQRFTRNLIEPCWWMRGPESGRGR